jgi:hypothetical protein
VKTLIKVTLSTTSKFPVKKKTGENVLALSVFFQVFLLTQNQKKLLLQNPTPTSDFF